MRQATLGALMLFGVHNCFAEPATKPTSDMLQKVIPEMKFSKVAFADVMSFMSDITAVQFKMDWEALDAAKVARNAPITLHVQNQKLTDALDDIFKQTGAKDEITMVIGERKIEVTTHTALTNRTLQLLQKPLPDMQFDHRALSEVIDTLSRASGVAINVDWHALAAQGFDKNTPISLRSQNQTAAQALSDLLSALPAKGINQKITDNGVTISTSTEK